MKAPTSKIKIIIQHMNIDKKTGVSEWVNIEELETKVGFPLKGNGSPYFQKDRGIGKMYALEKAYSEKPKSLRSVRTVGYATYFQVQRAHKITEEVKRWFKGHPCSVCGTTHSLQIDHKDGGKQPIDKPTTSDFQVLCVHCNARKREVCKKCQDTGKRFDARILGFNSDYTTGSQKYDKQCPRCTGCFWNDPKYFRSMFTLKEHECF